MGLKVTGNTSEESDVETEEAVEEVVDNVETLVTGDEEPELPARVAEVNNIIGVVWTALVEASGQGMPLSRDGAAIAFTEILIRLTVAHAKQTEGGTERLKEIFDL